MKAVNLEKLPHLVAQAKHKAVRSSFNAMKFQLLGNAALVDYFIRFNVFGAVQPGALTSFSQLWREHTHTEAYLKAKQESEKAEQYHVRRSKQIYLLKEKVWRAQWNAGWIAENPSNWDKLESKDQRSLSQIDELRTQLSALLATPQTARHAGAGSAIAAAVASCRSRLAMQA